MRGEEEIKKKGQFEALAKKKSHKSKGESCFRCAERAGDWRELEYVSTQMQILAHPTVPGVS